MNQAVQGYQPSQVPTKRKSKEEGKRQMKKLKIILVSIMTAGLLAVVLGCGKANITLPYLPNGEVNVAYSQTIQATGGSGSYSKWSITSGTLPLGLSLNSSTGVISGTPTQAGVSSFTVKVTDGKGGTQSKNIPIVIADAPYILTLSLPGGKVNTPYSQLIEAYGGSGAYIQWSIISGTLPPGLSLDPSAGAISGTPTQAGKSSFTAQVTDSNGVTGKVDLSITIAAAG